MQRFTNAKDKLALNLKDLELLEQDLAFTGIECFAYHPRNALHQENERLRQHVKSFQRDVNEILA